MNKLQLQQIRRNFRKDIGDLVNDFCEFSTWMYYTGVNSKGDEYFKNSNYWLHYVDPSCRYLIKE